MVRATLILLLACGAVLAQDDTPTPRQSFEAFIAAVLNEGGLDVPARRAELERCFDFEAWADDKSAREGREIPAAERATLREDMLTLLASEEFQKGWRDRVSVIDAPAPERAEAELTIGLSREGGRVEKFLVKLRLDRRAKFWRWYSITPIIEAPAPQTTAQRIAQLEARLEEVRQAEAELAALRAALEAELRELRANVEEERTDGGEAGTPRALVQVAGRALMAGDWGGFLLAHAPERRRETARARFDELRPKVQSWNVRHVAVLEAGARALVSVDLRLEGGGARVIALAVKRQSGRWWIDEVP